ncbi:unextended protein isoform X2 [Neocloeon triangulifer]|uniref:unextended protein isoform X2 n=1 Tax=Neocloeon triangulifer TaxID=2078957 RepID=UPI00286F097C|nr:unextended protein isoform X2 [Neocloeon triangulifer]
MDGRLYVSIVWCLSCFVVSTIRSSPVHDSRPLRRPLSTNYDDEYRTNYADYEQSEQWSRPRRPSTTSAALKLTRGARSADHPDLQVTGIRVEVAERDPTYDENGVPVLLVGMTATIRLFGQGFTNETSVAVTSVPGLRGENCQHPSNKVFLVDAKSIMKTSAQAMVQLPDTALDGTTFYICTKKSNSSNWEYAGDETETWLQIKAFQKMLPLWLGIVIIVVLLVLSGLFSGLNLGLMALDKTELKIVVNTGTETERKHARAIEPVRAHGNYLLCSLLLGNVLVNSTLTILMDDLTSGPVAVIGSTIAIVIFGEIMPQAICSRHGLAVGAQTVYITKAFMIITAPLSYPISLLLDKILGKEIGNVYNRERLKELIKVTNEYNDLEKEEVNIISGALELKEKIVKDVMTSIEDAFMLPEDAVLDFETLNEIREKGYSRIPVHEKGNRYHIVNILYAKDLAFVDSRLNMPVSVFCKFHPRNFEFVFEDVTLDHMLKLLREGSKGHMAFVLKVVTQDEKDPYYELVGLVTLEDIIEEMIKAEIVDETDMWSDNRTKRQLDRNTYNVSLFLGKREKQKHVLSPQLTLAAFQFLCTSVSPFKPDVISLTALRKLLEEDVNRQIKLKRKGIMQDPQSLIIYEKNKPANFFVLVLEGLAEVSIGNENLVFVARPFTSFGTEFFMSVTESALVVTPPSLPEYQPAEFLPDYTVRAHTDITFIKIPVSLYIAAVRATKLDKMREDGGALEDLDLSMEAPHFANASSPSTAGNGPLVIKERDRFMSSGQISPLPPSPSESQGLLPQENTQF